MGTLWVTLANGERLSLAQVLSINRLMATHGEESVDWHKLHCTCGHCVAVHAGLDAYLIGVDGIPDHFVVDGLDAEGHPVYIAAPTGDDP